MSLLVGTSGYAYKEWKGKFYPADLSADGFLGYYASQFPTVEINNTFYRMPKETVLAGWASQVPEGFSFVLKASQRITHHHRLAEVESLLEYSLRNASVLGSKLGPTLFQLPPNMKKDLPRLVAFLKLLPRKWRAALEFRHTSWFDDEVFGALRESGAALCIAESDDGEPTPLVATAAWGYARLHKSGYGKKDLSAWAKKLKDQAWEEGYVFFKHEDDVAGPKVALEFKEMVEG